MKLNSKFGAFGIVAAAAVLTFPVWTLAKAQAQAPKPAPNRAAPPARPAATPPSPAATAASTEAPAGEPTRTTASYGDWVLQCFANTSPPSEPVCDISQVTQVQGKNLPFSRIAVAHPERGKPVKFIVQVPVNVSFATQVHVQTSNDDAGFVAPFATCTPNGCFAEFELKDDLLKKLHDATSAGKISFADSAGKDVSVPISFNGFGFAYDALAKK